VEDQVALGACMWIKA